MIDVSTVISAPSAVAWALLTDTHAWPQWGPSVRAVDTAGRFIAPGAKGRVQTAAGLWLPFEITDWEEGRRWSWRVAGIPATGHRVTPRDANTCSVSFTIPSWAPFYVPVCRAALRKLAGLAAARTE